MGRHREALAVRDSEPRSNRGLPGWGLLTAVTAAAALATAGVPLWMNVTLGASILVIFLVLWQLSAKLPPEPKASAEGTTAEAVSPDAAEAQAQAQAQAREQYAAEPDASRWTRTFGPPETGQLPILRYVEPAQDRPESGQAASLRQWTHSRR